MFRDVRYDFRIKTMFGASLSTVVCKRAHVLFTLFVSVQHILCWFFLFCCLPIVYPMLPVFMNCLFLIAHRYSLTFIYTS